MGERGGGSPAPLDNSFHRRKLLPQMQRWLIFLFLDFTLAPSSLAVVGCKPKSQGNVDAVTEDPLGFPSPWGVAAGSPEWRPEAVARDRVPAHWPLALTGLGLANRKGQVWGGDGLSPCVAGC